MSSNRSSESSSASSVNLVRSTHSWTEADSAAGFVLRYLTPMRQQLASVLGSNSEADKALKILLQHLVKAGFGEHKRGRLRDFLVRSVRSCAKTRMEEWPEDEQDRNLLAGLTVQSKDWLRFWRDCLLERAWRALERFEHANPESPVYTLLTSANADTDATPKQLVRQIHEEQDIEIDAGDVESFISAARVMLAQLIADEVVETLENPDADDVKSELKTLGMMQAFQDVPI